MIPKKFSLWSKAKIALNSYPSFRFRDRNPLIHNASDAAKDSRQVVYKALKFSESNPVDMLGKVRMMFGTWVERGIKYDILSKLAPFGILNLCSQGDTGEHGTFYGTSWHGYRDLDIGLLTQEGKILPIVVEIKTKIGYGAWKTIKENTWSKKFIIPTPDQEWGYSQQLGLYLRDAYNKTLNNPAFSKPITDGILLYFLFADGLATMVEYFFEYLPDTDQIRCYRVHCDDYPECCDDLNITLNLKDIAERFKYQDAYITKKELPPPDFQRKYDVNDPRVRNATKTDLQGAIKGTVLIGDKQSKYSPYRDLEAKDLGLDLTYSPEEIKILKGYLKNK